MQRFIATLIVTILCALTSVAWAAVDVVVTPGTWDLYVGTSKTTVHDTLDKCVTAIKALNKTAKYRCVNQTGVMATVVPDPVTCPAAPAASTATIACPSGYKGIWTQTTTYAVSAPPACAVTSTTTPTVAPDGACTPIVVPPPATGRVVYVDASAPNDAGAGTVASPKQCLGTAAAMLSSAGGETLVIKPGVYSRACDALSGQGRGSAGAWNTIKAETDGTVTITAGFGLPYADHWLQFEGLLWDSPQSKGVTGRYVKILRSAFRGGPAKDNTVTFGIGTNDKTPGAQYVLLEDVQVYGPGGRYNVLVYNSDKVVLRRVVARHEAGWSDTKGDPQAGVSLYNSTDVLTQNLVVIDSGAPGYFEAALYHPSNSRASANIRNVGAIVFNTAGSGVGWDDGATVTGMTLEQSFIVNSAGAGAFVNGGVKQVLIKNTTIAGTGSHGVANWSKGTDVRLVDVKMTGVKGELIKGAMSASGTAGASVGKVLGRNGTLWGEEGYDAEQDVSLWPWPQEALVKARMCAGVTTGLCTAGTLTEYLRGAIGQ